MFRQLIEDSRSGDRAQVIDTDEGRQFYQLHPFKRIVVMFAGPFMNLILAVAIFVVIVVGLGVPTTVPTVGNREPVRAAGHVDGDHLRRDRSGHAGRQGWPAARATRSSAFAGTTITSWDQMRELIRASAGQTVPMTYDRSGVQNTVQVPIVANTLAVIDDQGNQTGTTTGGFLGISAGVEYQTESIGSAFVLTGAFHRQRRPRRRQHPVAYSRPVGFDLPRRPARRELTGRNRRCGRDQRADPVLRHRQQGQRSSCSYSCWPVST